HGAGACPCLPAHPRPCPSSHGDAGAIPLRAHADATSAAHSPAPPFPLIEGRETVRQTEGRWSVPCHTADGQPARLDLTLPGARFTLAVLGGSALAGLTTRTGDALAHLLFQTGRLVPLT